MAAGHGAGTGGDEEPLLVVLAPAAPQPVAVLLALGAAELADQALRHHLVKPLPVLLGDENPGKMRKESGVSSGAGAATAQSSGSNCTWERKGQSSPSPSCALGLSPPQSCKCWGWGCHRHRLWPPCCPVPCMGPWGRGCWTPAQ